LVLLVFRNKVVHVRFSLSEFHLVHAFTGVPVEECLAAEHSGELLSNSLEHLLDGGGVSDEGRGHLEALRRDVADGRFDVVRDPLDEVGRVLVLHVEHLLVDFLGGHASSEESGRGELTAVSRVSSAHHVLSVEHLLGEFRHSECSVLLGSAGGERSESDHEEVQSWEWHQVDCHLPEVGVESRPIQKKKEKK